MKRVAAILIAMLAAGPAMAAPSRVDVAVGKAVRAMGGEQNIHALKSLVLRGFHYEGAYKPAFDVKSGDALMVRMQPDLRIVGCRPEIPGCKDWGRIVEGWDGKRGWELNWPKQRLIRTVNLAQQALKCGAEFMPLFVDYKARGFKAAWLGPKTVLGKKTVAIRVDQAGCSSQTYYFNPSTYALEMSQAEIPVHARGALRPTLSVYSAFITVNGVRWPAVTEDVDMNTREVLDGGKWTSIQADLVTDPKIFDPPQTHPQGVTAVAMKMLEAQQAHAATDKIMALYDRFRATPEGKAADVAEDMHWVGYEFLKVDDFADAFAVFNRMLAENPKSDLFYDSLGDAYAQKGDRKQAVAAYEHALALNPKSEEVRAKRAKLAG